MAVFNRYARKAPPDEPPDDDYRQIAAQQMHAAPPPAAAAANDGADDYLGIAHQQMAGGKGAGGGNVFGNVDHTGQQSFGGRDTGGAPDFSNRSDLGPPASAPAMGQGPQAPAAVSGSQAAADAAARQAAEEAAKRKAHDATTTWQGTHPGQAYDPNAAPNDGLDEVARQQLEAERQDLDAEKQRQLQGAAAAAGLSGLGLSGGATTLQGDLAGKLTRENTIAIGEREKQLKDDAFSDVQRQAAIDLLEEESDLDENHDGLVAGEKAGVNGVGDGDPDNNLTPLERMQQKKAEAAAKAAGNHTASKDFGSAGDAATHYFGLDDPHTALRPNGRQPLPRGFDPSTAVDGGLVLGGIAGVDQYIGSDDHYDYYKGRDGKVHRVPR
jgi:hypothetical protein